MVTTYVMEMVKTWERNRVVFKDNALSSFYPSIPLPLVSCFCFLILLVTFAIFYNHTHPPVPGSNQSAPLGSHEVIPSSIFLQNAKLFNFLNFYLSHFFHCDPSWANDEQIKLDKRTIPPMWLDLPFQSSNASVETRLVVIMMNGVRIRFLKLQSRNYALP